MRWITCFALLLTIVLPTFAQTNTTEYTWEIGNLVLLYPANWETPAPFQQDGLETLHIAQAFANAPASRPPAIPFMILTIVPASDSPIALPSVLQQSIERIGINPSSPFPARLASVDGISVNGISADNILFGVGRAAVLPDGRALIIVGRALSEQRETFLTIFDTTADSIVLGTGSTPNLPQYGVLWHTQRLPADGTEAFLNIGAITLNESAIVLADSNVGLVWLDATTGNMLRQISFDVPATPTAIVVDDTNTYVADVVCACVQIWDGNQWSQISGFAEGAPRNVAFTPDHVLYATDIREGQMIVRAVQGGDNIFSFGDSEPFVQPLLATDLTGRLLALTEDNTVYVAQNGQFIPLFTLDSPGLVANAMTMDSNGHLVIASANEGIVFFDSEGNTIDRVGRIVANFPLAGELVNPQSVAVGADGILYWADSDGSFGNVTAMSTRVESGRVGATQLRSGVLTQGTLGEFVPQQSWTFRGAARQSVTLVASAEATSSDLDVSLRLLAPDGREVAFNDDDESGQLPRPTDAKIADIVLPQDGIYIVVVERIGGEGRYQLALSQTQLFDLSSGSAELNGELSEIFTAQDWAFEGRAGQVLTITLLSGEGSALDSVVRLISPQGTVIAENDDADDFALGRDSQIVQFRLPSSGLYIIEAARFDGQGRYRLLVVVTS